MAIVNAILDYSGIIALAISITSLWYARQRTKIMEEHLKTRQRLESTSKVVRETIRDIKQYAEANPLVFSPLDLESSKVLAHIHDNRLERFELRIEPEGIKLHVGDETEIPERAEDFWRVIQNGSCIGGVFHFGSSPRIFDNYFIELGDFVYDMTQLHNIHTRLVDRRDVIDTFDITILDELEARIKSVANILFESLMSRHDILIGKDDKSEEIYGKLLNEICGFDKIKTDLRYLSHDICNRLDAVQKEMYLKT